MSDPLYGRSPREAIVDVMKRMYERGLIQCRGGNASIYDPTSGIVYLSPSGVPRFLLEKSQVSLIELETGRVFGGDKPSSEWRMHLEVYKSIPGARGIVHAHPKNILSLLYLGMDFDLDLLSEAKLRAKCITRVPFIQPGSRELAEAVGRAVRESGCNVVVLERHGVLVYSSGGVYHALDLLEALEDLAYIQLWLSRR